MLGLLLALFQLTLMAYYALADWQKSACPADVPRNTKQLQLRHLLHILGWYFNFVAF